MNPDSHVKVYFKFFNNVLDEDYVEGIWATVIDKTKGHYRLDNVPFFVESYSNRDVVYATDELGQLVVQDLVSESGHSTLQIISYFPNLTSGFQQEFERLGCSWEGSHIPNYFSVDVPVNTPYKPIKDYLTNQEEKQLLAYKEACLAH